MDDKKAKIGRKLSRVLSIFRKKSTEEAIKSGLEPVYEELIYSNGSTDIRLRFEYSIQNLCLTIYFVSIGNLLKFPSIFVFNFGPAGFWLFS